MSSKLDEKDDDTERDSQQLYFSKHDHSPLLLRLAADMFRKHSDLFLQQAATLERISATPAKPESWNLTEASPESIQASIRQEQLSDLVVKSYESMCQVQKRVDYLEQLLIINGVGTELIPSIKKPSIPRTRGKLPMFWLAQEHGDRLAQEFGSKKVKHELIKLWHSMNPAQRMPYIIKADNAMKNKKTIAKKGNKKQEIKNTDENEDHPPRLPNMHQSELREESSDDKNKQSI